MRKRLEVPIGSKQMLLLHVDRRWLYKMVIGTANVNSTLYAVQNDTKIKFNLVLYIYNLFYLGTGVVIGGYKKAYNHETGTTDDLIGTREQNRGLGGVSK